MFFRQAVVVVSGSQVRDPDALTDAQIGLIVAAAMLAILFFLVGLARLVIWLNKSPTVSEADRAEIDRLAIKLGSMPASLFLVRDLAYLLSPGYRYTQVNLYELRRIDREISPHQDDSSGPASSPYCDENPYSYVEQKPESESPKSLHGVRFVQM